MLQGLGQLVNLSIFIPDPWWKTSHWLVTEITVLVLICSRLGLRDIFSRKAVIFAEWWLKTKNCSCCGRLEAILSTVDKNPMSSVISASSTTKVVGLRIARSLLMQPDHKLAWSSKSRYVVV